MTNASKYNKPVSITSFDLKQDYDIPRTRSAMRRTPINNK